MKAWETDKAWADGFMPEIRRVMGIMSHEITKLEVASLQADMKQATDYVVTVKAGCVACRIRKPGIAWDRYKQLTLRARRPGGIKTELAKIIDGYGDWYLYAWAKPDGDFHAWIFVDLDALRETALMEERREQRNPDGSSWFIGIGIGELWENECLTGWGGAVIPIIKNLQLKHSQLPLFTT